MVNKIIFLPYNVEAECASKENIFLTSQRTNIQIPTACHGIGTCGLCRIQIISGEEHLNKQTKTEFKHLGNVYHINKKRLACQCKFVNDGTVVIKICE